MGIITINQYAQVEEPVGSITLVSSNVDSCESVTVLSVDPQGSTKYTSFEYVYGYAVVTPTPGVITSVTQYTITITGYQSPVPSANTDGTKAKLVLKASDNNTVEDQYGIIRGHTGSVCGDVDIDPDDTCEDCIDVIDDPDIHDFDGTDTGSGGSDGFNGGGSGGGSKDELFDDNSLLFFFI